MLPSTLSRGKTFPISLDYMLPSILLGVDPETCRVTGAMHRKGGGGWWWVVAAKIMMSVDIIV
jgi:hypothetical protein